MKRDEEGGSPPATPESESASTPLVGSPCPPSSLTALCAIAAFHQIAADPANVAHQLGLTPSDAIGPHELLLASKHLGLKAKLSRSKPDRLALTPLPALALLHPASADPEDPSAPALTASGSRIVVLAQCDGQRVLLQDFVVSERTKLVQPLQTSVVRRVLVKDGDHVQAGQALVELDPTDAKADSANVQEQRAAALSEELRTAALLQALAKNAVLPPPLGEGWGRGRPGLNPIAQAQQKAQLQAEWQDIRAKLSMLDAEASHRQAEATTVQQTIAKLEATLPMAHMREADFKRLVEQGYISSHATQDKTRERVELESDLATQRARLAESRSAQKESEQARAAYLVETERLLHDRHAQASTKRQQLDAEQAKAAQREKLTTLVAPADGTVQQLAIHSVGGVATEAQALMVIVPDGAEVTAEVVLDNKDIGFVRPSDEAVIKLETFPFTRYGTLPARVERVTADSVNDEKRGAVFSVSLALLKKQIDVDGNQIKQSPGMNLTAEIKTGKRRVIEYLLSPIQRATGESLRER